MFLKCIVYVTTSLFFVCIQSQSNDVVVTEAARLTSANTPVSAMSVARNLADNILHIVRSSRAVLEMGLDDVMSDHAEGRHASGDTYFRTNNRDTLRNIINLVVSNPDAYRVYQIRDRRGTLKTRMNLRKTIRASDVRRLIGHENIGRDSTDGSYVNHVILVFDISNVTNLGESLTNGAFLTAFPTREDFREPQ